MLFHVLLCSLHSVMCPVLFYVVMSTNVMSTNVMSTNVMSTNVMSSYVMSTNVMSSYVMLTNVMSSYVMLMLYIKTGDDMFVQRMLYNVKLCSITFCLLK